MFRESAARLLVPTIRNALIKRHQSVVTGPPTNHVSGAEKLIVGGGMCVSFLLYPAWVLYHIREYRGVA